MNKDAPCGHPYLFLCRGVAFFPYLCSRPARSGTFFNQIYFMYKTVFNKRESFKFKHFSRKGYALFACLGREVLVGTLSVATLTYAKADGVSVRTDLDGAGTADSVRTVMLGEVDVTASRAPLAGGRVPRIVTVLGRDEIAAAPAQSVNDLLKYAVGVDVRQRGPIGAQTDISIRGGTSEHIAILLNGINICDPQTGHNAFDLPVDISEIERIEVIEGPAGRVFGTSSLLGAVNVVTRKADGSGGEVHASGGSFGYADAGARFSLVSGKWRNQVSGGYTRSDGYSRSKDGHLNADYEGGRAFYQGGYEGRNLSVDWHAGMSVKGWGSNTFYSTLSDEQYEHTNKYYTALKAETAVGKFHLRPSVYWNRYLDRYEFYRGDPERSPFNYHRTDVMGLNLDSWFDWALGRTAFGAEFRNEDIVSTTLGEPLDEPKPIHGTDRSYGLGLNRTNLGLYLEHDVVWRGLTVSAGFTAVRNTWSEMPFKLYPGIDASYALTGSLKAYASFNMSLRMPSFTELYYSVDGHKADKHLKPEEMTAVEVGLRYARNGVVATLSVYRHWGRNMIDWLMDSRPAEEQTGKQADGTLGGQEANALVNSSTRSSSLYNVWTSVNHARINSTGVEANASVDFRRLLPGQGVLRSLGVSYAYIDQNQRREPGVLSLYALEYLRHKVVARLGLDLLPCLALDVSYRYQYREGSYTDTGGVNRNYRPYSLVDARLAWNKSRYSFYVEANNLFDADYVDYGNVPQPGLWVMAGVRFGFEL